MKLKIYLSLLIVFLVNIITAQVGVGTTSPNANLDIRSSSQATPANTDGILIPKVDAFPITVPTAAQQGMLVYLTTVAGSNQPGFYYWDNTTTSWIGINSALNSDADWYKVGTTTAPMAITDNMFHSGNVAIGKNTAVYPLEIQTSSFDRGINNAFANNTTNAVTKTGITTTVSGTSNDTSYGSNTVITSTGSGTHIGSVTDLSGAGIGIQHGTNNNLSNSGDNTHFGTSNYMSGSGIGTHYATYNNISGTGTGQQIGTRNTLSNSGNNTHFGVSSSLSGAGSGTHYGNYTDLSGGTGDQYGSSNNVSNISNGLHYGTSNILNGTGTGAHYGNFSSLTGAGTGRQYGVNNSITNTGNNIHYGMYNDMSGTGSGNHFGIYTDITGIGTGLQYGSNVAISNTGSGIHYGNAADLSGTGTGDQYGNSTSISNTGSGIHYGTYNSLSGAGTGQQYGVVNSINTTGNATHYGSYNLLNGTGTGNKFGSYSLIDPASGGTNYGVYSEVLKAGANYAGYFLGNVAIGTTALNNYLLPPSRGTNGQIMQTDGLGNVTWQSLNSSAWLTTGNTGTTSASNYFGTTDDVDIVFKRFNIRAGFIGDPNVATGNKNTSFGANSLNIATGTRNTAIGTNVMPFNSTGFLNVSVGDQSMYSNVSGSENTVMGVGALYLNTLSSCNVAIGRNALTSTKGTLGTEGSNNTGVGYVAMKLNTTGAYNTALGREALYTNLSGNNNVGVGYQAGFSNSTGNNNVFLGNQSGYNETGSNRLYISNSNANATNALVYGEFDNKILRANGQLQIGDPATTGYKFPTTRGTNKQTLETDASGNLSWVTANNSFSLVRANLSASQALNTSGWQIITFNTINFDTNSEFNIGTNRFVATKAGYYQVNAGYHTDSQGNTQYYSIGVRKNGAFYQQSSSNHFNNGPVVRTINCVVQLGVGDYIEIFAENYQPSVNIDSYSGKTFFEVQQIR